MKSLGLNDIFNYFLHLLIHIPLPHLVSPLTAGALRGDPDTHAYPFHLISILFVFYNSYGTPLGIHPFYRWINPFIGSRNKYLFTQNTNLRVKEK